MKKLLFACAAASTLSLLIVGPAVSHHGPEEVQIDAAKDKRSAVAFPHRSHTDLVESCDTCHHTLEGLTAESDADVRPCSSCHLDPEESTTPSMREMSLKKNPFHTLCIDCHETEDAGPTTCNDCHPKD